METQERSKVGLCWAVDTDVGQAWVQGAEPGVDERFRGGCRQLGHPLSSGGREIQAQPLLAV